MFRSSQLMLLLLLLLGLVASGPTRAQELRRAALVVQVGETTLTRCVSFAEDTLSGYEVLARSGLNIVAAFEGGAGAAICAIENAGCPPESCLTCQAPHYWSYWRWQEGQWRYSQLGVSNTTVRDGDVEGWSWGQGSPPPEISFAQICAALPTPLPTATPLPPTLMPTATLQPLPEAWFRLDANPVPVDGCTLARWDAIQATAAYLDGASVPLSGSRELCPIAPLDLTLRVVNTQGERSYTLTLGVITATATPTPGAVRTPHATATILPTAVPTDAPTSTAVPSATPTPTPLPTRTPTASPSPVPTATVDASVTITLAPAPVVSPSVPPANYLGFGALVGGLVVGFLWRVRRRG